MKKILLNILFWPIIFPMGYLKAQIFTLSPGTDVVIRSGTVFFADSLILIPSSDFTFSNVSLKKKPVVTHPLLKPYIARVYQFSNTTKQFNGTIQFYYNDSEEINGIAETGLTLNINNGARWKDYKATSRDAIDNYVLTSFLCGSLNELTLAYDCPAPKIQCNGDLTVNAGAGTCKAAVVYDQPIVTCGCGNVSVTQITGLTSGANFPVGNTVNTFVASDLSGKTDTCSFTVLVKDTYSLFKNNNQVNAKEDYFNQLFDCKISPNPSSQYFNLLVTSSSTEKIEIKLFDTRGRFIASVNTGKNRAYRFGDDLRPGVYIIEIRQGVQIKTLKAIKQ